LSPESELQPGDVFGGYVIQGQLGQGGVGTVYCATSASHSAPLALKVLKRDLTTDSEYHQRFLHEARRPRPSRIRTWCGSWTRASRGASVPGDAVDRGRALDRVLRDQGPLPVGQVLLVAQEMAAPSMRCTAPA